MAQTINTGSTQAVVVTSGESTHIIPSLTNSHSQHHDSTTQTSYTVPIGKKWIIMFACAWKRLSTTSVVTTSSFGSYPTGPFFAIALITDSFNSSNPYAVLTAGQKIYMNGTATFTYYEEDA